MNKELLTLFVSHYFSESSQFIFIQVLLSVPGFLQRFVNIFLQTFVEVSFERFLVEILVCFQLLRCCIVARSNLNSFECWSWSTLVSVIKVCQINCRTTPKININVITLLTDIGHLSILLKLIAQPPRSEYGDFFVDILLEAVNNAHLFKISFEALNNFGL